MSKTETSETYIGTKQAASRLHLSVQRVRKLAIDGRIRGAFKERGQWRIPVSASGMPKISRKKKGPKGTWRIRQQEIMTYIHVNQGKLSSNRNNETRNPVISVKMGQKTILCHEVKIPGVGRFVYDPDYPKNCGATLWFDIEPDIPLQMNIFS
ncbi:MAG: helix-turn-helix domain-containing protein [Crocosphaera sp.]